MFSRYYIPLGMQPRDLPNGGIPTECSCVGTSFSTKRCKPTACYNARCTQKFSQSPQVKFGQPQVAAVRGTAL
ncbi:MAG: hypothetical protein LBQ66_08650 [Planctomycetaceae bacterium]|nr:hypothetical protein [Planctomycetaceae bacterium]